MKSNPVPPGGSLTSEPPWMGTFECLAMSAFFVFCGITPLETCELKERPMLVLSRKLNESIVINDNVVVTVLGVQGDRVRLGIEAPGEIPVHRQEVYEKMQTQAVPLCIG
jgi:carbon storage regulator